MSEPQGLFLPRVADLNHVADLPHQVRLPFFTFFLKEPLQHRRVVEMIFDRVFAFSGDDDDVFDTRCDALLRHILNLRLGVAFGSGCLVCSIAGSCIGSIPSKFYSASTVAATREVCQSVQLPVAGYGLLYTGTRK